MKKLAIGCGIVIVLLVVVGGFGAWYVYHRVRSTIAGFAELATVPDIERAVITTTPFVPPESGELTAAQVTRFVAVQEHVRTTLGAKFVELNSKYKTLADRLNKKENTALDFPEIVAAYQDLATTYVEAKRAQVDALNANGFSLPEYQWVRRQSYLALGLPVMDMDVSGIIAAVKSGRTLDTKQVPATLPLGPSGPAKNKELVEPHKKFLEDNAALSFFGL